MKATVKIKTWVYRPDLAKVKPEYLLYKGKSVKATEEDNRLIKMSKVLKQILIDY